MNGGHVHTARRMIIWAKHTPEKVQGIVVKTARKMSPEARTRVRAEFDLPDELAAAFDL